MMRNLTGKLEFKKLKERKKLWKAAVGGVEEQGGKSQRQAG